MILYLIYAEYEIGKLCQYCTTAHIAHLISTFGFFRLASLYGTSEWVVGGSNTADATSRERRSRRGGYVAPKAASEEE